MNGSRSPQPSEGQQGLQLRIQSRLGLLSLPFDQQIIQEPTETHQPPGPVLLAEPVQQAIAAGGEAEPPVGMNVIGGGTRSEKRGHGGSSAAPDLQAGRGQVPAQRAWHDP